MGKAVIPRKQLAIIACVSFGLLILAFGIYAVTSAFSWHVKVLLGAGGAGMVSFWILGIVRSRTARYGSNLAIAIILAFFILILVNFVSVRRSVRIDTTTGKHFSLSEQTRKILNGLEQDIHITGFYSERHYRRRAAQDILEEYTKQSNRINLTFTDPYVKPGMAIRYQINQDGTVIFELGNRREDIKNPQNEEQEFTSAILKLLAAEQKKVYFLEGHGERDVDGTDDNGLASLREMIIADNYLVDRLVLTGQASIPDDCAALVIAGAQKTLMPQEEDAINRYLDSGGKAIIMVDPTPSVSLESLMKKWGIEVRDDIILDVLANMDGAINIPAVVRYKNHPITIPMGGIISFFPMIRSVIPAGNLREGLEVVNLMETSSDSWGEKDTAAILQGRDFEYNDGSDVRGPISIAVAVALKKKAESQPPEEEIKEKRVLVAIGDSDFITNRNLQAGNPDLFLNSLNWLLEAEELISIRPKNQEEAKVQRLTGRQLRLVAYSSIFAIPLILLIISGLVWWKRR